MTTYRAAEGFHPGEYLREELKERGWSQLDFAAITGELPKVISELINARRSVNTSLAIVFEKALGPSAEYWLRLQTLYDLWKAGANEGDDNEISRKAQLYTFPIRDMAKRGWIDDKSGLGVLETELRRFFETNSVDGLSVAAKRSNQEEALTPHQIAWLYRSRHLARAVSNVSSYSSAKLESAVDSLRQLLHAPEETRQVPRILSSAGVRFVVVEALPGLKLDGVCFWIDKAPVIALSMRYDRIDNFWFVLRHEIEHVLRGDAIGDAIGHTVPDSVETTMDLDSGGPACEQIANKAAMDFCVPDADLEDFLGRKGRYFSSKNVAAFARRIEVHPGLVVGQLHRRKELSYENLRKFLVKVRKSVTEAAMTDGWGMLPQLDWSEDWLEGCKP